MARIHVVPAGGVRWAVKHEGNEDAVSEHSTEQEHERAAEEHARGHGDWEVLIHGRDGRIRDSDTLDRAHEGKGRDRVR
jgi:hypothetical protein